MTDLSRLGNGRMYLGSRDQGTFVGTTLAPGKDNVYRLGGGGIGGIPGRGWTKDADMLASGCNPGSDYAREHWMLNPTVMNRRGNPGGNVGGGLLTIEHSVLAGDADVTVGAMSHQGYGAVLLKSAQAFSGALTVQGPNEAPWASSLTCYGSYLEGVAQRQAGQSPFGSVRGPVRLVNSTIKLTGVPGGQPVAKGELQVTGLCNVALDANMTHPARLTVARLFRDGRSALTVDPLQELLGDREKLVVSAWKTDRDLLPPWCLYASTKRWCGTWGKGGYTLDPQMTSGPDFLAYDATGGKGFRRFTSYATDLAGATEKDVVKLGAGLCRQVRMRCGH